MRIERHRGHMPKAQYQKRMNRGGRSTGGGGGSTSVSGGGTIPETVSAQTGNTIQLAFPAEFQAAWNELLSASVEIDDKLRLAESDLGDDGSITTNILIKLNKLLGE